MSALSPDSQAIALLCSALTRNGGEGARVLTPTQWRQLSSALHDAGLRPRDLPGQSAQELAASTGADAVMADRLAELLARGGQLALELERLDAQGIWIVTRADDEYPSELREKLGPQAPPVLFGAGSRANLRQRGIAVVGSRDVDEVGLAFTAALAGRCADMGLAVVSGGARGVDLTAMAAAAERGGIAVGITVDPLERLVRKSDLRAAIADERLTLITPFHPAARWTTGNAMGRNRLIYAMARAAVVVASSANGGGTRAGALEDLKAGWAPLYVRDDGSPGNTRLLGEGATPLPPGEPAELDLDRLLESGAAPTSSRSANGASPHSADAYLAVWPLLESVLHEPQSEKDVAAKLGLKQTQARSWLERACDEQKVEITKRPKRYVLPGSSVEQLRLGG
jgi:predicted Rossmann fold nucleotide-binding protein DprA/Smf involved in DNA uptake